MSQNAYTRPRQNAGLQRMPQNQKEWTQFQNELYKNRTGSFTPTFGGFDGSVTSGDVFWTIHNNTLATIKFPNFSGTSDAVTCEITNWPVFLCSWIVQSVIIGSFKDNSVTSTEFGWVVIPQHPDNGGSATPSVKFGLGADNPTGGGFTASNDKGLLIGTGVHCTYSIIG